MKKLAITLTIAILVLTALTACGKKAEPAAQDTTADVKTTENETVPEETPMLQETAAQAETVPDETVTEAAEEENTENATEAETPQSVEDIVALYNAAANKVKPEAKQITRT